MVSRCLLHLCHVPCDERCSVQCTYCNVEVLYVVTTVIRLACSVSNMTRLLWSVHVHMVSALYRILTGSFCRLTLYGLCLPVRISNKECLTDNGNPAVLSARAHLLDVIFGDYWDRQFFLLADSLQTLLPSIGNTWIIT